jgi:uncharacterized protein Veg
MFNSELKEQIRKLENEIESLKADNDRLRKQKKDAVTADVQSSTFVIDWSNMNAFSIERMGEYAEAYTIIGYWNKNESGVAYVAEWKFYCSQEQHEKLAKEFADGIAKKINSTMR